MNLINLSWNKKGLLIFRKSTMAPRLNWAQLSKLQTNSRVIKISKDKKLKLIEKIKTDNKTKFKSKTEKPRKNPRENEKKIEAII